MGEETPKEKKSETALREEAVLKYWLENKIFEKSLEKESPQGEFTFYDGPPFATGLPHYGHILASTLKDVVPRYKTMRGYHVPRRWGWDCHGLPLENIVEQELDLKTKKDIEEYGIKQFNETARVAVLRYAKDWKEIIPRLGRWVDMEHDYRTMDATYSETIWWIFKTLFDKGLVYEGYKSMHICPRCETTLANFEVNQGYKDITDISVTVKFPVNVENFFQVFGNNPQTIKKASDVYFLAWTTTPWTLPGNVALAVNPEILYVLVEKDGAQYILAKNLVEKTLKENYSIIDEFPGSQLVGLKYRPLFDYYANDRSLKNRENGWQVYAADFVTTEDGTGIVHIAPAFGEDDYELLKQENLPFVQHVSMDGKFKPEVTDFAGEVVKPKDDHQKIDIEIIKYLAGKGTLFAKEKIVHPYPHCWRCETPLLNYAANSWFVRVPELKDKLLTNNQEINWVPDHIKEGRFGKWLEGARDWAISRSRFWGAPLPVWKCDSCKEMKVIGSVAELKNGSRSYHVLRHGEADHNVANIISTKADNPHHLTDEGRAKVKVSAEVLKPAGINLIVASDFVRTKETAAIVAETLGLSADQIIFDPRLREMNFGNFEGRPVTEYRDHLATLADKFNTMIGNGESVADVRQRVGQVLYEVSERYSDKNVLFITHETIVWLLHAVARGMTSIEAIGEKGYLKNDFLRPGEYVEIKFNPLPHNDHFELDLHRPYIDAVVLPCACATPAGGQGGQMRRIPEVFDCWFESGAMPYGQAHYPFENKGQFDPEQGKGFPADFIAEGLDQTRGWFYSLLVLGTALFGKTPFKNVVVNGIILAEDGQKMSKRLKNYPDPMFIVEKYGADALRFYLLSSPTVRAEDLNFSEKGVGEIQRKVIMRLWNTYTFFELYSKNEISNFTSQISKNNILDQWIIARLNQAIAEVGQSLEAYELDRACRPIDEFIDDLSNWYLRRSRDRFKSEDVEDRQAAIATTHHVLKTLAQVMAPFTPFIAEELYLKLAGGKESVHLEAWPKAEKFDENIIGQMAKTRILVSLGLEARMAAGIKVRQPLAKLTIKKELGSEYVELIKDEINVKSVVVETGLADEVKLDTAITEELKEEGEVREFIRQVQEARKAAGYHPGDLVVLAVGGQIPLLKQLEAEIKRAVCASTINFDDKLEVAFKIQDVS